MNKSRESDGVPAQIVKRVTEAFLIITPDEIGVTPEANSAGDDDYVLLVHDAVSALRRVVSAGSFPFQITLNSVQQRRFDRILSAERIRCLKDVPHGDDPTEEQDERSYKIAQGRMASFLGSAEGSDFMRDNIVLELDRSLNNKAIESAAHELITQTIVSTWSILEVFSSKFIIAYVNNNPRAARSIVEHQELKKYFGKQSIDIEAIDAHGFDLTRSMGSMIFYEKRLDNLSVVRDIFKALFRSREISLALGKEVWLLNQRRHLFVHRRGVVDKEYIDRTGDTIQAGEHLTVTSGDAERYLRSVENAIQTIYSVGSRQTKD